MPIQRYKLDQGIHRQMVRSIEVVKDHDALQPEQRFCAAASLLNSLSAPQLSKFRYEIRIRYKDGNPRLLCAKCSKPVYVSLSGAGNPDQRDGREVLSSSVGAWQTWPMKRDTLSYLWISIPTRHYQPRRLAVSPLRCELSRCRRSPGPTRHYGVLRSDPAVVPHVRFSIRSPAQASTGPAGRHLAPGRGLRHHPGTAALSLACRRSRW